MKKNKMMRLASAMMVLTLMSTSVISGTFAKYVTTNSGSDSARVAKFGVQIDVNDNLGLFSTTYAKSDSSYAGTLSVESTADDRVVAPGTKGSMTFKITGTPEVATRVSIEFDASSSAIQLPAGEYTLPAGYFEAAAKTVTTSSTYEPIKYYFGTKAANTLVDDDYTMTLEQLKTAMNTEFNKDYDAKHNFAETNDGNYTLAWNWAFEDTTIDNVNFLDTYLGYEAATYTARKEVLNFKITVTQID